MHKRGLCCCPVSVRLSRWCGVSQTVEDVKLLSRPGSPIILVFWPRALQYPILREWREGREGEGGERRVGILPDQSKYGCYGPGVTAITVVGSLVVFKIAPHGNISAYCPTCNRRRLISFTPLDVQVFVNQLRIGHRIFDRARRRLQFWWQPIPGSGAAFLHCIAVKTSFM